MKELTLTLHSEFNPLVIHNPRLSIAHDPITQQLSSLTSKRSKTLDDHMAISRTEWSGGLYWDPDLGPYLPTKYPSASLWQAAKLSRQGEALRRAVTCLGFERGGRIPIEYEGPRDLDAMWSDEDFRLVQSLPQGRVRVTRTRPRFIPWKLVVGIELDDSLMDLYVFEDIVQRAARNIGIGEKVDGLRARYEFTLEEGATVSDAKDAEQDGAEPVVA